MGEAIFAPVRNSVSSVTLQVIGRNWRYRGGSTQIKGEGRVSPSGRSLLTSTEINSNCQVLAEGKLMRSFLSMKTPLKLIRPHFHNPPALV